MSKLIIIRGNSASGKTTVATNLRYRLGYRTMLVSQDTIRREIVRAKDGPNNPSIELIQRIVLYGKEIGYDVILEGILAKKHYFPMLKTIINEFDRHLIYYFDIPFEESMNRHSTKSTANEYGETEMRAWWNDKDWLGVAGERIFTEAETEKQIVDLIVTDLND